MPRSLALLPVLAALLLAPACHPDRDRDPTPPDALAPLDPAEVIEWFLGEQVRGPKTSNRAIHLGILTRDLSADPSQAGVVRPSSCAPHLVSFIPDPAHAGVWLATNEAGKLLRYAGDGWSPVTSNVGQLHLGKLIAIAAPAKGLELLLVSADQDDSELSLLVLVDDVVTKQLAPDRSQLSDRAQSFQHYDSHRCAAARDCLNVAHVGETTMVMREPEWHSERVEVPLPPGTEAQDVRYADATGKSIDLLTPNACPDENAAEEPPDDQNASDQNVAAESSPDPAP